MKRSFLKKIFVIIVFLLNLNFVLCLEPITSSIVGALGAIGVGVFYSTWDYFKCSSYECCHRPGDNKRFTLKQNGWQREPWIDYEVKDLESNLNMNVHGQHLVKPLVFKLIRKHMTNENPDKALVLSFHGWTGSGKNFVSEIVAKNIFRKYRDSRNSDFVRKIFCSHFNTNDKQLIKDWIRNNITEVVKKCGKALFIIDEIDYLPEGVIDIIKPFIDYHNSVDSIDYRKTIFIFLSNTGGTGITRKVYEFHLLGKERTDLTMKDLEPLINSGAFNENGGLHKSDIVEKNLIDAYIPFLPLEKKHIKLCIIDYLKIHHNKSDPTKEPGQEFIRKVSNEMEYSPPDTQIYSKTGCKRVGPKVDALI